MACKLVIAGVSGCGKTTVGQAVARLLDCEFFDADDFHPPANVAKMEAGQGLDDEDRREWLTVLGGLIGDKEEGLVLACSALKPSYRERLRELGGAVKVVLLEVPAEELRRRVELRSEEGEHYMPPSLLDSQLATLDIGDDMLVVRNEGPVELVAEKIVALLEVDG